MASNRIFGFGLLITSLMITSLFTAKGFAQPVNSPGERRGFVQDFDKDGDGKVSKEEFFGPADHFTHLDRNGDGYIDESEAPKGPPPPHPGRGGDFMTRFDKDDDGKVSKDEFPGPEGHFTRLDQNGDGYVDEGEAPKGPPPQEPPGTQ